MASGSNAPFSGDHTDLENVSSGQHHPPVSPDSNTIIENANGNLEVAKPSAVVIGDFEQGIGGWTKNGTADEFATSTKFPARGSQSYQVSFDQFLDASGEAYIGLTKDLTPYDTLKVSMYLENSFGGSNEIFIDLDNTRKASVTDLADNDNQRFDFSIDLQNINTTKEIRLGAFASTADETILAYFDDVRLVKGKSLTVSTEAGN